MHIKFFARLLSVILTILSVLACRVMSSSYNLTNTPPTFEIPSPTAITVNTLIPTTFSSTATLVTPPLPKFAYVTYRETSMEIYGSQIDGSEVVQLTSTDDARNWDPAFSPDCTQLAYEANTTGTMLLYILQLGSDRPPRLLTSPDIFSLAVEPSWSPAGDKIVFSGRLQGDIDDTIFTIQTDGSKFVRLTKMHAPGGDYYPSWSPDGKYIAYINTPQGATAYLTLMNPDGSGSHSLLAMEKTEYGSPSWSPDSTQMAIVIPGVKTFGDIAIINIDGSGLVNLTNSEDQDWEPAWSPDGKHIAFMNGLLGDDFNIFLMNIDGSGKTPLINSQVDEHQPAFCPIP